MAVKLTKKQKEFEEALSFFPTLHSIPQVYFVKCGEYTKIGYTQRSIKQRFEGANSSNPYPIEFLFSIFTLNPQYWEKVFHLVFAPKRHKGEWFKLTDADLSAVYAWRP